VADTTTAIRIEMLPARMGDCLLVECAREGGRPPWRMLIDGGPPDTWPLLEQRLQRLDPDGPSIDVVVISHIDSDHIGGMVPFLDSEYAEHVGDYWFNGRTHLPGVTTTRSVKQGESVVAALLGETGGHPLPWNLAFGGGPIDTGDEAGFIEVSVEEGPLVTVLSPTTKRLAILAAKWFEVIEQAKRGTEKETVPDVLDPLDDLVAIAGAQTSKDSSVPNGSSIALLIEHRGAGVVLGADAFGNVLGAGITGVASARGLESLPVDAFKLPHHASQGNVFPALLAALPARHYLVSTNGDTYHHPDDAALARVVLNAPADATLWFNYRTQRTARWAERALCERYHYTARLPDSAEAGVTLELPARP
jgi:beta-lactamase superfamily II metal-dependent hydrolase